MESGEQDDGCLEQVAVLNLAYVHLCLHDPLSALTAAERFLAMPGVGNETKQYLAHTYAAEALCLLGREAEAMQHLIPGR